MICGGLIRFDVQDLDRAVRFYVETLGMKLVAESTTSADIDAGDGLVIELRRGASPGAPAAGDVAVALRPKMPLAEARAILENRGVVFDASHGFTDPDGHRLALLAPR